jgi:hypothetical protein
MLPRFLLHKFEEGREKDKVLDAQRALFFDVRFICICVILSHALNKILYF